MQGNATEELAQAVRRNASIPPSQSCSFHSFLASANGVIHVGAHTGQEREVYGDLPVLWIEALPLVYGVLCEQIADKPNQRALNYLIADGKPHKVGLSSNACLSSSIYDFARHRELWPDVGYIAAEEMLSRTLTEVIEDHAIDLDVYNALVLDVQGAELLALKGAGEYLSRFRWIQAEAADFESYAGGCTLSELDEYLALRGFARVLTHCGKSKTGVGSYYDVLYRNTHSLPKPRGIMQAVAEPLANGKAESNGYAIHEWEIPPEQPLRLNLGAGAIDLPGFTPIDRKTGGEVYPLDYPDGSVEEIVASHILEHFSHREVPTVLAHWVAKLKPGGKIRLAVPNFELLCELYQAGAPVNTQGYVMGGHVDANDRHGCLFDRESLTEAMIAVGLERIGDWDDEPHGCADNPLSLNLMGFKPSGPATDLKGVRACMSVPRFGPLMHPRCAEKAFFQLRIECNAKSSCYWAQQISNGMEEALEHEDCRYVLTMDFDTVFSAQDVMELYRLMEACPDVDAVFPLQSKRGCEQALFSIPGKTPGTSRTGVSEGDLSRNLLPAGSGHFGLTLFRADSLRKFPRPWMVPEPSKEGTWNGGHRDADIDFWKRFREAGFKAYLAPKVVVGHLEEVVKWPGKDLKPIYQQSSDYDEQGIPAEVKR